MSRQSRPVIVVGVSSSRESIAALRWAADEAHQRRARLVAVRAWQCPQTAFYAVYAAHHAAAQERQSAASELASALHTVFGAKLPSDVFTEVIEGFPERVLVDQSVGADMVVLGEAVAPTQIGRSPGPVIRACLSRAHCPVVVVGSPSDADMESSAETTAGTLVSEK
jgi:nucleotide-binding universal stress UspA family protein